MDVAQVSIPNLSSAIRRQMPADAAEITRLMRLGFDANHSARAIWRLREGAALGAFSLVVEAEEAGRLLGSLLADFGWGCAIIIIGAVSGRPCCARMRGWAGFGA